MPLKLPLVASYVTFPLVVAITVAAAFNISTVTGLVGVRGVLLLRVALDGLALSPLEPMPWSSTERVRFVELEMGVGVFAGGRVEIGRQNCPLPPVVSG